jgi:23S rRNA (cytidine1920-2'-O)/16S rRNA (cytidine1409-2'-O)-methyltransferase
MARRHHRRFVRLVDRLEVESVREAVAAIVAGRVMVNGLVVTNPDAGVATDAVVALVAERVLRGTVKLQAALAQFGPKVSGRVCLDVGAAAGGFTAALLEAGARRVYAVDAGYGQLAGWLRQDSRVVILERTNLAELGPPLIPEAVEVICLDLSYLALADAVPQLESLDLSEGVQLIGLVKPTFELHASSVIVDGYAIDKAVEAALAAIHRCGWSVAGKTVPVTGGGGAPEVFIYGTRPPGAGTR